MSTKITTMSQYIKQLQDKSGNDIFPITGSNAVFHSNGRSIEEDAVLTHTAFTAQSNIIAFTTTANRTYGKATLSANTSVVLNIGNGNEHYLLVVNSSASAITIAISGSASETILGNSAIEVPAGKSCEMSFIKDNGNYVVTYFVFE